DTSRRTGNRRTLAYTDNLSSPPTTTAPRRATGQHRANAGALRAHVAAGMGTCPVAGNDDKSDGRRRARPPAPPATRRATTPPASTPTRPLSGWPSCWIGPGRGEVKGGRPEQGRGRRRRAG